MMFNNQASDVSSCRPEVSVYIIEVMGVSQCHSTYTFVLGVEVKVDVFLGV